jgi:tryptophan-rich sensory protein
MQVSLSLVLLIVLFLGVGFGLASHTRLATNSMSSKLRGVFPVMWAVLFVLQATALWISFKDSKKVNLNPAVRVLIIVGVLMGWLWLAAACADGEAGILIMAMGMLLPFLLASVLAAHTHPSIAACLLPTVAWLIIALAISVQRKLSE